MTNPLAARLRKLAEYELDDHTTEWAKGIANEHARLLPLIAGLIEYYECSPAVETDDRELMKVVDRLEKLCSGAE